MGRCSSGVGFSSRGEVNYEDSLYKALHFIAGMLVVAFVATIIPFIDNWAIIFAIIASIGKEIRD